MEELRLWGPSDDASSSYRVLHRTAPGAAADVWSPEDAVVEFLRFVLEYCFHSTRASIMHGDFRLSQWLCVVLHMLSTAPVAPQDLAQLTHRAVHCSATSVRERNSLYHALQALPSVVSVCFGRLSARAADPARALPTVRLLTTDEVRTTFAGVRASLASATVHAAVLSALERATHGFARLEAGVRVYVVPELDLPCVAGPKERVDADKNEYPQETTAHLYPTYDLAAMRVFYNTNLFKHRALFKGFRRTEGTVNGLGLYVGLTDALAWVERTRRVDWTMVARVPARSSVLNLFAVWDTTKNVNVLVDDQVALVAHLSDLVRTRFRAGGQVPRVSIYVHVLAAYALGHAAHVGHEAIRAGFFFSLVGEAFLHWLFGVAPEEPVCILPPDIADARMPLLPAFLARLGSSAVVAQQLGAHDGGGGAAVAPFPSVTHAVAAFFAHTDNCYLPATLVAELLALEDLPPVLGDALWRCTIVGTVQLEPNAPAFVRLALADIDMVTCLAAFVVDVRTSSRFARDVAMAIYIPQLAAWTAPRAFTNPRRTLMVPTTPPAACGGIAGSTPGTGWSGPSLEGVAHLLFKAELLSLNPRYAHPHVVIPSTSMDVVTATAHAMGTMEPALIAPSIALFVRDPLRALDAWPIALRRTESADTKQVVPRYVYLRHAMFVSTEPVRSLPSGVQPYLLPFAAQFATSEAEPVAMQLSSDWVYTLVKDARALYTEGGESPPRTPENLVRRTSSYNMDLAALYDELDSSHLSYFSLK